jgi:hypothetical protein
MRTTQADIRAWLTRTPKSATHMLVVCDTFSYEDYPVFVDASESVHEVAMKNNGPNMTRLMEVYNLSMDIETQLAQDRSFNY